MKHLRRLLVAMVPILWLSCLSSEEPTFDNPLDPKNGTGLPVPDSIRVTVGNNIVRLDWSLPDGEPVDDFVIYRRRLEPEPPTTLRLLKRVVAPSFQDSGVRNGQVYEYQIAAGRKGGIGQRSEAVEARPGLFAIVIADDAPKTRQQTVSVLLEAQGTQAVRMSENPDSLNGPWRPMSRSLSWTLSSGDGQKKLYAVFQYPDGSESLPASDAIKLDTQATIRSVDFDGSVVRYPGDVIRFSLDSGEPAGQASVQVVGLYDALPLFDDGSNGDSVKDDGVYERTVVVPAGKIVQDAAVSGRFTDDVGNQATAINGSRALSVRKNPDAVTLLEPVLAEPPDGAAVTLRWTRSLETGFAAYEVVRDKTAAVDSSDRLLVSISDAATVEFKDEDVVEGQTYFYRVYVQAQSGPKSGSNVIQATVVNLRPPTTVTLENPSAVGATRLSLAWSKATDLDFSAYRIHRNETGAVSDSDPMVAEINAVDTSFWDDTSLLDNTRYYYRVFTLDEGGLISRSNEVATTTLNEAPEAVTLSVQLPVEKGEVTLTWTENTSHDFAYYRLYRDESPNVGTTSSLRAEIDAQSLTSFRDTDLTVATQYYYRVFVVDDDEHSAAKSAGSNTVAVLQENPEPVSLFVPMVVDPPDPAAVKLRWTLDTSSSFASYRIFRDETPTVDLTDRLLGTVSNNTTVEFTDPVVVEGKTYYYRVFVDTKTGSSSGSNTVEAIVANLRAPDQVSLEEADATSSNRISLNWNKATNLDLFAYRLYRNETGAVGENDLLVAEITDRDRTFWDDTGLVENTKYHYRIYTVDQGSLTSRSNEVSSTTVNQAPQAVTLQPASAIASTEATLSWDPSTEHDFASYRLYRDTSPNVTTSSTLVVEIDEIGMTSFRDTALQSSTPYYYRVYVVDDGTNPGLKSTGSNTITFSTL